MFAKPHSSRHGRVIIEDLQLCPLLAKVHANIGASDGQVRSTLVKAEVADLVSLVQLNGFEVLEFPQIPKLDTRIIGRSGQVVTILGEGEGGDLTAVSFKVGNILLLKKKT